MIRQLLLFIMLAFQWNSPLDAAVPKDFAGRWHGYWNSSDGFLFEAYAVLSVDAENRVAGPILWTLLKSPRPYEQEKLGQSGVEYLNGTLFPESGVARLAGSNLLDPFHLLDMEKYRLILSDDGLVLGGITGHFGGWTGQLLLKKVTPDSPGR